MYPTAYRAAARAAGYAPPRGGFRPAGPSPTPILDAILSGNAGAAVLEAVLEGLDKRRPGAADRPDAGRRGPFRRPGVSKLPVRGMPFGFKGDPVAAGPNRPDGYREDVPNGWTPQPTGCDFPGVDPLVCGPFIIEGVADCLGGQAGGCESTAEAAAALPQRIADGATAIAVVYVYDPPSTFIAEQRFYAWSWTREAGEDGYPLPAYVPAQHAPVVPGEALYTPAPGPATDSGPGDPEPPLPPHRLEPPGVGTRERKWSVRGGMSAVLARAISDTTEALDLLDALHDALPAKYKCRTSEKHSAGARSTGSRSCSPVNKAKALYAAFGKMSGAEAEAFAYDAAANILKNALEDAAIGRLSRQAGKDLGATGMNFPLAGPAL